MKRVLALRPLGAPPTESLLETLMVQLARKTDGVPEPTRQVVVNDDHGEFVARVDLAWPDEDAFNELDGEHHKDQPVYDAVRETNVVIATGWLPGRLPGPKCGGTRSQPGDAWGALSRGPVSAAELDEPR